MIRAMIGGLQKVVHKRLYRDEAGRAGRAGAADLEVVALLPAAARRPAHAAAALAEGAALRGAPGGRQPGRAGAAGAGGGGRREGLPGDDGGRGRRPGLDLAAHLLRALRQQGRRAAGGARQRLGPDARHGAAGLPPGAELGGVGPGAYEAMFGFGIEEPEYTPARRGRDVRGGQTRAADPRHDHGRRSRRCSRPGYELAPDTPAIAAEAIGGAIYALIYDQVKAKGPESMPELVPMATYMTLAPFLGAEAAFELANS